VKRAGLHSGYYAVRVSTGNVGWAFYSDNRLARMRAAAEGGRVWWMPTEKATWLIEKGAQAT
jgi:hypothetical protein